MDDHKQQMADDPALMAAVAALKEEHGGKLIVGPKSPLAPAKPETPQWVKDLRAVLSAPTRIRHRTRTSKTKDGRRKRVRQQVAGRGRHLLHRSRATVRRHPLELDPAGYTRKALCNRKPIPAVDRRRQQDRADAIKFLVAAGHKRAMLPEGLIQRAAADLTKKRGGW